ncbi:MAG: SRPBCC domain-containing protein [Proteobacteria bacterium]|nr:SRPBCC domain-containing protein [Pseudomonadota bacterium]MBI3497144.1 SRPBCC domain-containing protein [Pseudomonadota bacterium]
MAFAFSLSEVIPASAEEIFDTWLDGKGHAAMTGGGDARITAVQGADFTVWNGYINGRNLALEPAHRIVQSWRTKKFTPEDPDSEIEVLLEPAPGGTKLTLNHSKVPDGHTSYRDGGWQKSYFEPMKTYFAGRR